MKTAVTFARRLSMHGPAPTYRYHATARTASGTLVAEARANDRVEALAELDALFERQAAAAVVQHVFWTPDSSRVLVLSMERGDWVYRIYRAGSSTSSGTNILGAIAEADAVEQVRAHAASY